MAVLSKDLFTVAKNETVARDVWEMVLEGPTGAVTAPGQFIDIRLESRFLRRPISVCDREEGRLTIIYKVVGGGTEILSTLPAGTRLDVLTGLGNGFDLTKCGDHPILLGGGLGTAPLYWLCRALAARGIRPTVAMGFDTAASVYYADKFPAAGAGKVLVATMDGTAGVKGTVLDAIEDLNRYSYFYTCGPKPMMAAIAKAAAIDGECSLEERMGCGFGACMGCSVMTKNGSRRGVQGGACVWKGGTGVVNTRVNLCGIELENPVIPASGTFGYGYEFAELYDINCLGTFSFKGDHRGGAVWKPHPPHC